MRRLVNSSEKVLEDRMALGLKTRGLSNFHMSSPSLPGIPDRYVIGAGGCWIEVKQGKSFSELRDGFDRQRVFLNNLSRGGDKAMICALYRPNNWEHPLLFIEPWSEWLRREKQERRGIKRWHMIGIYRSPWVLDSYDAFEPAWDHLVQMVK